MQVLADSGEWVPGGEDGGFDEEQESNKEAEADSSDEEVSRPLRASRAPRARAAHSRVVDSSDEDAPRLTPRALCSAGRPTAVERKRRRSARS
eukprot:5870109-Pleurochrysis_carterae.AAC.1